MNLTDASNYITQTESKVTEAEYWKKKYLDLKAEISFLKERENNTINIKENNLNKNISLSEIVLFTAESNYTTIHTKSGEHYLTSFTLKHWAKKLSHHSDFRRVHRSFLVNKKHILHFTKSNRQLILSNYHTVPIARRCQFSEIL